MSSNCSRCGRENSANSKFCSKCGSSLAAGLEASGEVLMPIGVISVKGVQNLTPGYSLNSKIQYQKGAYPMLILGDSGWKMYAEGEKVLKNLNLWEAPTFKGTFQFKPIFEPFDGKCWTLVLSLIHI